MTHQKLLSSLLRILKEAVHAEKNRSSRDHNEFGLKSRRLFLKDTHKILQSAAAHSAMGALALPSCITRDSAHSNVQGQPTFPLEPMSKVAIVGAGLSGLTLAYRLTQNGIPTQLFEGSDRIGGRAFTRYNANAEGMFIERGGEFVDTGHEDLRGLCHELGIELDPLRTQDSPGEDLYFVDGIRYSQKAVLAAFRPLAQELIQDQKLLQEGGATFVPTYDHPSAKNPKVIALDRMSLTQYLQKSKMDLWAQKLIESAYVGEYGLDAEEQSAINLLILIDPRTDQNQLKMYGESDEAFRIRGGSSSLTEALAKKLGDHTPLYLEHRLIALREETTHIRLIFDIRGKTRELKAEKVVLALPPPLLRTLDLRTLPLTSQVTRSIKDWGMGTNSKIALNFTSRPWQTQGSSANLYLAPLGQTWESSRGQPGSMGILTFFTGGAYGQKGLSELPARILKELSSVYPTFPMTFDKILSIDHWKKNPWSLGSYSCPKVGQYTSIYGAFNQFQLQGRLFFTGEHTSIDYSGYMNGAVQSAQRVADSLIKKRRISRL